MSEAKISQLVKRRGTIKSKITSFSNYINVVKDDSVLPNSPLFNEIKLRLEKIDALYEDFDTLQTEIEELTEDPDLRYQEREAIENQYYVAIGTARALLEPSPAAAALALNGSEVSSLDASTQRHNNFVRLPKIELPTFNGDYQQWLEFRDTFVSIIHSNDSMDEINKFHYLRACLRESASLVIKSLDFKANNYTAAWELLCKRYDNKRLLVNNHVQSLFNINAIQKESSKALRYIVDITNKNLRALATLDQPTEHWDTLIIYMMSTKLDSTSNREWEEFRNNRSDPPTLDIFLTFLSNRADLLETLEETRNKGKIDQAPTTRAKSFIVSSSKPKSHCCPLCQKEHQLFSCDSFRRLPVETRILKVKEYKVCQNCLRPGHNESRCKLSHCKYCNIKHNTLLHKGSPQETVSHDSIVLSANSSQHKNCVNNTCHILLSTALVNVIDKRGKSHPARILLDNGSTGNFVTQDLCGRLNLPTRLASSKKQV
ncbi:uncharacterized protein LOC114355033 isoform X2 [Ostrinia furnacalis]|uniref:uncharacterized protein LOC114355033 isoform X2 n=1 Tax=Ostrinia furnacalis TaxID=93504 RepID=UPI00103B7163|nr:uncharacterized protein LOC114355033 isoform X2 [Ostrinia furnacalis]